MIKNVRVASISARVEDRRVVGFYERSGRLVALEGSSVAERDRVRGALSVVRSELTERFNRAMGAI